MKTKAYILLLASGLIVSAASAKPENGEHGERPNPEEHFAKTDTNGDGFLSLDEIKAARDGRMAERFEKLDTDGDGLLSKEELEAGREKMKEKREERGEGKGEGKGDRPDPRKMFERMDADQSGGISKEEAKGPLAKNFDEIDADSDGEITPEEMKAFHEQKRGERGPKE